MLQATRFGGRREKLLSFSQRRRLSNPFADLSKECDGRNNWSIRHPREAGEKAQNRRFLGATSFGRHWHSSALMLPVCESQGNCIEHGHARMFRLPRAAFGRQSPNELRKNASERSRDLFFGLATQIAKCFPHIIVSDEQYWDRMCRGGLRKQPQQHDKPFTRHRCLCRTDRAVKA